MKHVNKLQHAGPVLNVAVKGSCKQRAPWACLASANWTSILHLAWRSHFTIRCYQSVHRTPCHQTVLFYFASSSFHSRNHGLHLPLIRLWLTSWLFLQLGFFKRKRAKDISAPMEESVPMAQTNQAWRVTEEQGSNVTRSQLCYRLCCNWFIGKAWGSL